MRLTAWSKNAAKPHIHAEVTLEEFLDKKTPEECLNCLDLPDLDLSLNQPSIIWCVILTIHKACPYPPKSQPYL